MSKASRPRLRIDRAHGLGLGFIALALSACTERNVQTSNRFDPGDTPRVQAGFFRAGSVEGLSYVSGGESGVTDGDGAYTCETDLPVSFSIGSLELGETLCATLAHPAALSPSGTLLDVKSTNIMRLLLILDDDQNFDNGIRISPDLQTLAGSWSPVDFFADDFDAELTQIKSDIATVENRTVDTLPSESAAFALLDTSIACAFSGIYINSVPAGPFNAVTNVALTVFTDADTGAHVAEFLILRNHPESQLFKRSLTTLELQTLPTYEGPEVSGEFLTPDTAAGSYVNAIVQQVVDRNGAFVVFRGGDSPSGYRFVGTFEKLGDISGITTLRGRIVLTIDGDRLSGEAFDLLIGDGYNVNGARVPGTDDFEFEIEGFPGSATATLVIDDEGEPAGLEGNWPGYEENVLEAVSCRVI